jgi:DedD protein
MDEQLKRRLTGATIIVALIVIFVPMLFEDRSDLPAGGGVGEIPVLPEGIEERTIELPKSAADAAPAGKSDGKKAAETGYRIVPLDDPPPKQAKAGQAPAQPAGEVEIPVEEDTAAAGEDDAPAAKPEAKAPAVAAKNSNRAAASKPKETPAQKPKSRAEPARPEPAGEVAESDEMPPQVAEEPEYPAEVPSKAVAAPVKAAEPPAKKAGKPKPADTTAAARTAGARTTGQKPVPASRPSPPESASTSPAAPAMEDAGAPPPSWVVQAGSFAAESNARALADKLRKQSLPVSVHVFQGDSGPVYRVTVGPELNRARAEQIQKQIENAVGIKGIILPH